MGFITSLLGIEREINNLKFKVDRLEQLALKELDTKYKAGDSVTYWAKDKFDPVNICTNVERVNGLITDVNKKFNCCGKGGFLVTYSIFDGERTVLVHESRIIKANKQ